MANFSVTWDTTTDAGQAAIVVATTAAEAIKIVRRRIESMGQVFVRHTPLAFPTGAGGAIDVSATLTDAWLVKSFAVPTDADLVIAAS